MLFSCASPRPPVKKNQEFSNETGKRIETMRGILDQQGKLHEQQLQTYRQYSKALEITWNDLIEECSELKF